MEQTARHDVRHLVAISVCWPRTVVPNGVVRTLPICCPPVSFDTSRRARIAPYGLLIINGGY